MASAANAGLIFVLLQRVAHALGVGEGCAVTASYPEMWSDHHHANSFRTAIFDGRPVTYGFGELDALVPAYAATIHKSQGSEYPAVVIPVMTQHYTLLQRNLLY